ncbi:MAG TPA: zf-HC2 domain-containing protein [Candidatus Binataceae bacterium]|nr:zf-HC2 domain-containing protein [Candidatus Binataceae bacterium]
MSVCDGIRLLLGPFDDGELEPHEMEDVALHVVSCAECKSELDSYRGLGVALRDVVVAPPMMGFTRAVMARVEQVPLPLRVRVLRYFDSLTERFGAGFTIGAAGALAAVLTLLVMTPYAHQFMNKGTTPDVQVASLQGNGSSVIPDDIAPAMARPISDNDADINSRDIFGHPEQNAPEVQTVASASDVAPNTGIGSSTFAVSDDPKTATTVIWVPDQQ